jgi:hypothetical protein
MGAFATLAQENLEKGKDALGDSVGLVKRELAAEE